ncbi:MAG: RnfABCDGE type electron transport complex subunit G [Bacteroidales bacterium]|jgi:Na+-translocating ferredoxin:NAD+ oxidoreductase subunit G|nr:RnfABCDGE type electron transport complex subunit G [Bacteroidales bacterium]MDD2204194.1 RnfABCDGE type electron transport complex subunit G [Bacteroidales bacterium]MDD3152868.1 RnfABCDGE type electron transport complex subunit G [Bacteroidales bacterium]MDD3913633.1 RnfABCDGE type electron transport complex subunit G [Bacteroidales bacterium]MDD4634722.1 RnfABCDGE type electron transport complex subunit G [Bacteroidales bacterium]
MSKLKSTLPNMVIVLGLIAAITSLLLAYVYTITKQPIDDAKQIKLNNAIAEVVPGLETFKEYKVKFDESTDSLTFYDVYKNDELIGTAVKSYDNNGFNGRIVILVGLNPDGNIIKTVALEQSETPGLGAKMDNVKNPEFAEQFANQNPKKFKLQVKKDKGDVDAITAATISSRAYCRAVQLACNAFDAQKGGAQ